MMDRQENSHCDVIFVVPPFLAVGMPSLGPSLLAGCCRAHGLSAQIYYANLALAKTIGYTEYVKLCQQREVGEAVFRWSALEGSFNPGHPESFLSDLIQSFTQRLRRMKQTGRGLSNIVTVEELNDCLARIPHFLDQVCHSILAFTPRIVGFSCMCSQTLAAIAIARSRIWGFYRDLKDYKQAPSPAMKAEIENRFDEIFTAGTSYQTLNKALARIHKNKSEHLLVLDRPEIPLHNNESETDIRECVKKRKISGSTRSDLGRRCRDTFASLKKTCRKLGVGFWEYLNDRVSGVNCIPWLPNPMRQQMGESPG
ncbi:transposase [Thermodesulfobacteriota bacterium]